MTPPPTEAEKRLAREVYAQYGAEKAISDGYEADADWVAKVHAGDCDEFHGVKIAILAIRKTSEAAVKLVLQQQQDFLSPEYATGQPLSSFQERFACGQIAAALQSQEHLEKE